MIEIIILTAAVAFVAGAGVSAPIAYAVASGIGHRRYMAAADRYEQWQEQTLAQIEAIENRVYGR